MRRLSLTAVVVPFLLADSAFSMPTPMQFIRDVEDYFPRNIQPREPWTQNHFTHDPEKRNEDDRRRWAINFQQTADDPDMTHAHPDGEEREIKRDIEARSPFTQETVSDTPIERRWVFGTKASKPVLDDEPVRKRWTLTKEFEAHLDPSNLDGANDPENVKRDVISRATFFNMLRPIRQARRRSILNDRMSDGSKLRPGEDSD
ncbi:MAG: hypothetical protein M1814_001994 [Vezdaea aestivalis]|nr:MAG: hypothetical protein M1814_001994 [Vezdaea aestivalis]